MRLFCLLLFLCLGGARPFMQAADRVENRSDSSAARVAWGQDEKKKTALDKKDSSGKKNGRKEDAAAGPLSEEQQRRYDYYYLEAARLKIQKEYATAFDLIKHCLAIDPNASSALYEIAQYYLFLNQTSQGLAALEKAVENEPGNYWYCHGLSNLYQQQNDMEKAVALLEEMSYRFTSKLDPLYNLLDIYNRQEKYEKVIATLDRLEERMGKNEQLSMEKFRIYVQMKDNKNALREIESLVAEYPMDLHYQVVLGDAYLQNDKKEEAYKLYRKVLEEEPDNALAMYSLASYYDATGQKELYDRQLDTLLLNRKVDVDTKQNVMRRLIAQNEREGGDSLRIITLFDRILEQDVDDVRLPMLYAQYLISKGMEQKAVPVLRLVLDIDPTNTAARMTLLGEAVRKEDHVALIQLCEGGVEANPDMLEFYFYLAVGYNQEGRTDDVIAVCRRAVYRVSSKSDMELVSNLYTVLGDAYHSKQMNSEAYDAYDSALDFDPDNIGALNNYAYYLSLERRDLDKAEEMSYKTVKAEPNNATYLDTYAWILFEKGKYAEARLYIDEAMTNDGSTNEVIVEHCGDIYYMNGDVEGALKYWKQAQELGGDSKTLKQKIAKKKYIAAP